MGPLLAFAEGGQRGRTSVGSKLLELTAAQAVPPRLFNFSECPRGLSVFVVRFFPIWYTFSVCIDVNVGHQPELCWYLCLGRWAWCRVTLPNIACRFGQRCLLSTYQTKARKVDGVVYEEPHSTERVTVNSTHQRHGKEQRRFAASTTLMP